MDTVAVVLGIVLLLACALLAGLAARRVRLIRGGGLDVGLRRRDGTSRPRRLRRVPPLPDRSARGWVVGVGHYRGDELAWYRLASLRVGADAVVDRRGLEILERRPAGVAETYLLPADATVLRCRNTQGTDGADGPGADFELALGLEALTGFLSWLEAGPPGGAGYLRAS